MQVVGAAVRRSTAVQPVAVATEDDVGVVGLDELTALGLTTLGDEQRHVTVQQRGQVGRERLRPVGPLDQHQAAGRPEHRGGEVAGPPVELRVADLGVPVRTATREPWAGGRGRGAGGCAVREEQGHGPQPTKACLTLDSRVSGGSGNATTRPATPTLTRVSTPGASSREARDHRGSVRQQVPWDRRVVAVEADLAHPSLHRADGPVDAELLGRTRTWASPSGQWPSTDRSPSAQVAMPSRTRAGRTARRRRSAPPRGRPGRGRARAAGRLDQPPARIHAVGERERLVLVVGHEHRGGARGVQRPDDRAAGARAQGGVQRGEGLVEQHHRRVRRQRPGEGDALLLAAGELVRVPGRVRRRAARRGRAGP